MTRDDIINLAREVKAVEYLGGPHFSYAELERFAALIAEHEREECAKVAESFRTWAFTEKTAAAIRARGKRMSCNGPCDQGRRPCPCPQACGISPPPSHTLIVRVIVLILVVYLTLLLL